MDVSWDRRLTTATTLYRTPPTVQFCCHEPCNEEAGADAKAPTLICGGDAMKMTITRKSNGKTVIKLSFGKVMAISLEFPS